MAMAMWDMWQEREKHTFNLAESFAREKSGGKKVTYTNPIAVAKNGAGGMAMEICSMWN